MDFWLPLTLLCSLWALAGLGLGVAVGRALFGPRRRPRPGPGCTGTLSLAGRRYVVKDGRLFEEGRAPSRAVKAAAAGREVLLSDGRLFEPPPGP